MPLRGRSEGEVLREEGRRLLAAWPQAPVVSALAVDGRSVDTHAFADLLQRAFERGGAGFVIGGSLGLAAEAQASAPTARSRSRRSRSRTSWRGWCCWSSCSAPARSSAASRTTTDRRRRDRAGAGRGPRGARTNARRRRGAVALSGRRPEGPRGAGLTPSRRVARPDRIGGRPPPGGLATRTTVTMSDDLYDMNGLAASLQAALDEELAAGGATEAAAPAVELSFPARPEHGDVTTNAALVTAKRAGRVPRELAEAVGARWLAGPGAGVCDRYEVAGPGFLNLFLNDVWYRGALGRLLAEGADYGRGSLPAARRTQDERGVRQRQSHRAAARRSRALRVLRRRALPHPLVRRSRRDARVLRQRLRHADDALRAVARRPLRAAARPRHAGARGGLPGRLRARARRRGDRAEGGDVPRGARGGGPGRHGAAGRGGRRAQGLGPRRDPRAVPADARASARAVRRVDAGELALPGRRRAPRVRRRGGQVARGPRRREAASTTTTAPAGSRRPGTATTRTASSSARPATPRTSSATSPTTATRWTAGSST